MKGTIDMDIRIFVITHKDCDISQIPNYKPLLVGAVSHPELRDKYLKDDTGENISDKNDSYCELTGLYWIWKNVSVQYVGLVHYRRFFAVAEGFKYKSLHFVKNIDHAYRILNSNELLEKLHDYDIIVKQSVKYPLGNESTFINNAHIGQEKWNSLINLVKVQYPEYYDVFCRYSKEKQHINCNMFVCRKKIIDNYCEWLFTLLDKLDNMHIRNTGHRFKDREMGYFAEFLFGVWIYKNQFKIKVEDVVNIEGGDIDDGIIKMQNFPRYVIKSLLPRSVRLKIRGTLPIFFKS